MGEVVDIIHNLSYTVTGEENLKDVINNFDQQAKGIDALKAKLAELKKAYDTETDVTQKNKQYDAILRLNEGISTQTLLMQRQMEKSKPLQQAMVTELGIIQKLTDKLRDLRYERERATSYAQINQINAEITAKRNELTALTGAPKDSSILGGLLGGGSLVSQGLKGVLLGVGFGSGIGLISRVVSGLIEYAQAELDAVGKAEKLQAANENLNKSFAELGDQIVKYNQDTELLNYGKDVLGLLPGEDQLKRELALIKSLGIVQGEIFEAEQQQFAKSQEIKNEELRKLQDKYDVIDKINKLIESSQKISEDFIKDPNIIALSAGGDPQKNKNVQFELFNKYSAEINKRDIPQDIKDKVILDLKKGYDEGTNLLKLLTTQLRGYSVESAKINQEILNKKTEIDAAEKERQSKINEEIYQLDQKLKNDLSAADERYQQDRIKAQVTTASTINKSIELETAYKIEQIERQRTLERKKLSGSDNPITPFLKDGKLYDPESKFNSEIAQTKKDQEAKRIEQLRAYYDHQVKLYEAFQVELASAKLASDKQKLPFLSPLDEAGNLAIQQDIIDNELYLQRAANSAKYDEEVKDLEKLQSERRKRHEQETQEYKETEQQLSDIYHEFARNEEDFIRASNIRKLNEYADYYAKFIQLVKSNEASVIQAIALRVSLSGGDIRKDKGFNFLNKQDQLKINNLLGGNQANTQSILLDREALEKAQRRSDIADANRFQAEGTGKQYLITAAIKEQQAALDEIVRINKKIKDAENSTFDNSKEVRKIYIEQAISDYNTLAQAAVSSFNIISEARQKDLDREISVRTQRVDLAFKLAERGNTQALAQEQKALEQAEQQKRKAALVEQEVNAALTVSNALVAVAKAAAEGGVAAPATIALAIAAIGVGFAEANALAASQKQQFWKGGYTGEGGKYDEAGTVHKGEFVFDKETTSKHRELFEAIHKGYEPFPVMRLPKTVATTAYADKKELREISDKMDMLIGKNVNVSQVVDKSGVNQIVVEEQRAHARKWAN